MSSAIRPRTAAVEEGSRAGSGKAKALGDAAEGCGGRRGEAPIIGIGHGGPSPPRSGAPGLPLGARGLGVLECWALRNRPRSQTPLEVPMYAVIKTGGKQ